MKADDLEWLVPNQTFVRHVTNISVTFRATEMSDDILYLSFELEDNGI
jgi:hypothetical protein